MLGNLNLFGDFGDAIHIGKGVCPERAISLKLARNHRRWDIKYIHSSREVPKPELGVHSHYLTLWNSGHISHSFRDYDLNGVDCDLLALESCWVGEMSGRWDGGVAVFRLPVCHLCWGDDVECFDEGIWEKTCYLDPYCVPIVSQENIIRVLSINNVKCIQSSCSNDGHVVSFNQQSMNDLILGQVGGRCKFHVDLIQRLNEDAVGHSTERQCS